MTSVFRTIGRRGRLALRGRFLSPLRAASTVLEIGPFDSPLARDICPSATIRYADLLSTAELRARAATIPGRDPNGVPEISYVGAQLSGIAERFDAAVSAHLVEHVPDLIGHLNSVHALLKGGGTYLFLVPDRRRCFDRYLFDSDAPEVIAAHFEARVRPTLRSIIAERGFATHQAKGLPATGMRERIEHAAAEFAQGDYTDVHSWQFTPSSMRRLLSVLSDLALIEPPVVTNVSSLYSEIGVALRW